MRHGVDGRKLGRNTSHRIAMYKNMAVSLIMHEQIQTTVAKAKELRRVVDRLVTLGKKQDLNSRRLAFARLRDDDAVKKLFSELATRFNTRPGGYTRVLRLDGTRWGDGAEVAVIELVDRVEKAPRKKSAKPAKTAKTTGHDHDHDHHGHDHNHKH